MFKNVNSDFLKAESLANYDLILGVDIVFQFIAPLYAEAEANSLSWILSSLKKGGSLLLELRDFADFDRQISYAKDNIVQSWEAFPEPDPFEFVLAKILYDKEKNIRWEKMFLERNSVNRSSFINILKPYRREDISKTLEKAGFSDVRIFNGFIEQPSSETYIVLATK